jgi:1-acyl-sn-glycerol-3-phosphate acyltransferase
MAVLRSVLFMIAFYLGSIPVVTGAALGGLFSKRLLHWSVQGWTRYHRWCARNILGIRIHFDGDLNPRPVLYAIKHESMFEAIELPGLFGFPAVVAKKELFQIPLWGRAAAAFDMIAVDRDAGAGALRKMIAWGKSMRQAGRPITIFPEGTRVPHGERPPLQSGFAGLYKLLGMPVVPVAVNSGLLCPRGTLIRRSGTITYKIGAEIPAGLSRDEIESRVHAAINALND